MVKYRIVIFVLLTLIFSSTVSFLSKTIVENAFSYRQSKEQYSTTLNYRQRLLNPEEYLIGDHVWQEKHGDAVQYDRLAVNYAEIVQKASLTFAGIVFIYLLFSVGIAVIKTSFLPQFLIAGLAIASLHLLVVGIFSPMLEISAFEVNLEIPFEIDTKFFGVVEFSKVFQGEMFFYYQSKSIFELITLLFTGSNYIVAIAILVFTIIVPIFKFSASLLVLLFPAAQRFFLLKFFAFDIGKWSMADVFVVATFLAYLSFNNMSAGIKTESHILPGLYFFLGYCIVSLLAAQLCKRQLLAQNKIICEQK